jgi:LPS-assembly protein
MVFLVRHRARGRQGVGMSRRAKSPIAWTAVAAALAYGVTTLPMSAQEQKARLLVEAKEVVYDNDKNTVSASGDAELHYQGRTLQADRVIYDRKTGRVFAEGNARLTEANGTVTTGDRFELTDDFKSGFIDTLRVEQRGTERGKPITTRLSAPRAERAEGESTVFQRGTYTACEACEENPERPPFWQVKAARIIHNNSEHTVYFENATVELLGVPIAYMPYFWAPDPTVRRKTGFLSPHYITSSVLGTGVSTPFFWNLAPNYDITLQPTYYTKQGVLGQAEWRHRLLTGAYNIRAAGIIQQDTSAFLPSPNGPGNREARGSIETAGRFHINERWRYGWDIALFSDKWFLDQYRIRSESIAATYFRESISSAYLQGQGDRSWFDMRGYYFQGLTAYDWQKQLPIVHPVIDYNKRINGPEPLGGEVGIDVNLTSLSREAAAFSNLPNRLFELFPGYLYESCAVYERGKCLVRGVSGTNTRLSAQLSWRRDFIDPFGQVWTPFAYARADAFFVNPNTTGYINDKLPNFISGEDEFVGRAMPAVGLEYRYPLVADAGAFGTHVLEPIGQIIARPNEARIGRLPNEDAQSLVFEDTSLFNWDKFSGYDRAEGGVRANLGVQHSMTLPTGLYANGLFGQSFQLAGQNSFRPGDLANVGRDSGLETTRSDYVGRFLVQPSQYFSLYTKGRFDESTFAVRRFEAGVNGNFNPWLPLTTSLTYASIERQPELGYNYRREGISASAAYNLTPYWSLSGAALLDLSHYQADREAFITAFAKSPTTAVYNRSTVGSLSLGATYRDECTTFSVSYSSGLKDFASGTAERAQTVLVRLELRTLGAIGTATSAGGIGDLLQSPAETIGGRVGSLIQ